MSPLRPLTAAGTPRQIGVALGQAGRAAVHRLLRPGPDWQAATAPQHGPTLERIAAALRAWPALWAELEGLAEGLDLPLPEVLAWNCRGDLLAMRDSAPEPGEGCTTVQIPGPPHVIAHNEDGLPELDGHGLIADLHPEGAPRILAFCYPGSLPGHTFAVTGAGLVQAVNNLRLRRVRPGLSRMALGRLVLAAPGLDAACALLRAQNACGGFHMTLAQAGDPRLLSVEYGAGACHLRRIEAAAVHANHALHLDAGGQEITRSSADRQARGALLLAQGRAPLEILRDADGPGLPIHRRAADDPDRENTLATAVMTVGAGVGWQIYGPQGAAPLFSGQIPAA